MKKIIFKISILCLVIFCVLLSGCTTEKQDNTGKLNVVAVNFPQYDFARAVCGDKADVKMLVRPGAEVHGYEPSLSDITSIRNADVFIYGGGISDVWVERILASVDKSQMTIITLMDIESLSSYSAGGSGVVLSDHGHNHSHSHSHTSQSGHHDHNEEADEHVWTSPKNAMAIVEYLGETMIRIDPENKSCYKANTEKYIKALSDIDKNLEDTVKNAGTNLIAVADRFPFVYLAGDYGISYIAAFSGCSPESDAGPKVIAHMIEEISHHNLDYIFHIELSNQKMADAICEHTGAKKLLLHSCQNVTEAEFATNVTYAELMEQNVKNLKEALN